ncbi:MAG: hypothetical protein U9R54_01350, partial [Bacteroidota bacterium]|nr:hypothetical protein [Bacteroidota bacterium]
NITILDFGSENTKKYNKIISHISTKPNRRGLQASKEALLQSFNKANKKLINYIYNCDSGIEKFEILN